MINSTYHKSFTIEVVEEQHEGGLALRLTGNSPLAPTVAFLEELPQPGLTYQTGSPEIAGLGS
jgi:hypothetical protein